MSFHVEPKSTTSDYGVAMDQGWNTLEWMWTLIKLEVKKTNISYNPDKLWCIIPILIISLLIYVL